MLIFCGSYSRKSEKGLKLIDYSYRKGKRLQITYKSPENFQEAWDPKKK